MTTEKRDGWPRLPDEVVSGLLEHEQLLIRQHEEETIAASKMQLADICENCHIKPQFAKTYRVLRRDLREMLEQGRARLSQPHPELTDAFCMAMLRSTEAIIKEKLLRMGRRFQLNWDESIENWAGKEGSALDKSGCLVVLAVIGSALSGLCALLLAFCI